jgi:GMP synthase-like glutamine amidotransferase
VKLSIKYDHIYVGAGQQLALPRISPYCRKQAMKIGILEVGLVREQLADRFDSYPVMFEHLLALTGRELEFTTYSWLRDEQPGSIFDCDGWLITGSRHGVYDELEWMAPLQQFIREVAEARLPLIGVCFGHQIVAAALGGEVVKSDRGWGVGAHSYRIDKHYDWMQKPLDSVSMYAFHQDQVVTCPSSAEVFLSSDFCPYAGLSYGDSIISVQAHPEFEEDYERALLEMFSGSVVPAEAVEPALEKMAAGAGADTRVLAEWFVEFFLSRAARAGSAQLESA